MTEKAITFIRQHSELIHDCDWVGLYGLINNLLGVKFIHEVSNALKECGYDVVSDMGEVPNRYLVNDKEIRTFVCPSNCKRIGRSAFRGCERLTDVKLNEGLEEIAEQAFAKTGLRSITIPKSVKKLHYAMLADCNIVSIIYNGTKNEFNDIDIETATFAFCNCRKITCTDGDIRIDLLDD